MKSLRGLVGTVRRGRFPERSQRLSFTCGLLCMCHGSDGRHPRVHRLVLGRSLSDALWIVLRVERVPCR